MTQKEFITLAERLRRLGIRYKKQVLALWRGESVPFENPEEVFSDFEDILNDKYILELKEEIGNTVYGKPLIHALIEFYTQKKLYPYEAELQSWRQGAAAYVNGKKIYFGKIIRWCQKESTIEERRLILPETKALCNFLKKYAYSCWQLLLDILSSVFGYGDYLEYCQDKKGIDYDLYYQSIEKVLKNTDRFYFEAMEGWARRRFSCSLTDLTRFDAINMLALAEFDHIVGEKIKIKDLLSFFLKWEIDVWKIRGLHLDLEKGEKKSDQAICFVIDPPYNVHVVMNPHGGLVDIETIFHEMGHALFAVSIPEELDPIKRCFGIPSALSESFAFLLQEMALSIPFMVEFMGFCESDARAIAQTRRLRNLSLFRRYAAKFMVEYEMFRDGNLENGERYAELLKRYTGFYYQPECHIFDLVPEFYSLDYLIAWVASSKILNHLEETFGDGWMFKKEGGDLLRTLWEKGAREDLFHQLVEDGSFDPFVLRIMNG